MAIQAVDYPDHITFMINYIYEINFTGTWQKALKVMLENTMAQNLGRKQSTSLLHKFTINMKCMTGTKVMKDIKF